MAVAVAPLGELAAAANHEHDRVREAGLSMVEHAIRAGDALRAADELVQAGQWERWLADNFADSAATARLYMRMSRYQDEIRARGIDGVTAARRHLIGRDPHRKGAKPVLPQWMRDEAAEMRAQGISVNRIARELGVSNPTVHRWTNPQAARALNDATQAARRRKRAAERALAEQQQRQQVKRRLRKAGAAEAELYAMAERMQDVMGQAHREATDPAKRRHYARAGEHYRRMRDEIVQAILGGDSP